MTDREFVESVWDKVHREDQRCVKESPCNFHGFIIIDTGVQEKMIASGKPEESWSAAAEFTRARLEEIRQVEEEIDLLKLDSSTGMEFMIPSNSPLIAEFEREYVLYERIISRLIAIRDDLKKGMKP